MKLYRILRQHRYNGGNGNDELQSQITLYCGYDRDEARRMYHGSRAEDSLNCCPGSFYVQTVAQSLETVAESA